jgi:hypothetical protein
MMAGHHLIRENGILRSEGAVLGSLYFALANTPNV